MLLVCPSCDTHFRVPAGAIAESGRQVRCASCAAVWLATPAELIEEPQAVAELAEPAAVAPRPAAPAVVSAPAEAATLVKVPAAAPPVPPAPPPEAPREPLPTVAAPPLVPEPEVAEPAPEGVEPAPEGVEAGAEHPDIETLAHRPTPLRRRSAKPSRLTLAMRTAVATMAAILIALISMRTELVRLDPGLAGLYEAVGLAVNLRGLELHEVQATREVKEGVPVLLIDGYVYNPGPKSADVPKLRLAVLASTGRELYAWTAAPATPMLLAGEGFRFTSRLASPPQEARDVLVRFLHRRDLAYESR